MAPSPLISPTSTGGVRAAVADSWVRSAAAGVRAERIDAPITLPEDELREFRAAHPLAQVFPLLDDVLGQTARDCDAVMAVADAQGQLLWLCGTSAVLRRAESIGFVEGSNWDERLAGTNAPGMALQLDAEVNIIGAEHFRHSVQRWSCAATPIHDPVDHSLLGVLDVTGGDNLVVPQTMAMLRAAARMAEAELARQALVAGQRAQGQGAPGRRTPGVATWSAGLDDAPVPRSDLSARIEALGRDEALLTIDDGRGHRSTLRLSRRHSEILVLLAATPRGLSGDELAVLVYEEEISPSTLRVELGRLRSALGDELLTSRPYRLDAAVAADWLAVDSRLSVGDIGGAMRGYRGPLLPGSVAPGIVRLRQSIEGSLRQAVLTSAQPDLMSTWTRSGWGADDYDMWQAQGRALGANSPLRPMVAAQLTRLDRELGVGR